MSNAAQPDAPHEDGLEWLRAVRRELAAEANLDPAEMIRRLREREREMPERMFKTRRVLVSATSPVETSASREAFVAALDEVPATPAMPGDEWPR